MIQIDTITITSKQIVTTEGDAESGTGVRPNVLKNQLRQKSNILLAKSNDFFDEFVRAH